MDVSWWKIPDFDVTLTCELSRDRYGKSRGADDAFRYNPTDPWVWANVQ